VNPILSVDGVELTRPAGPPGAEILSPDALRFVAEISRAFEPRRRELLEARRARQERLDAGEMPAFLPATAAIRSADWTAAPIPRDLRDRRVEITGPVDRKMIINALNSGASVFMADFEDSNSPTWSNVVEGQVNLKHAVAGTLEFHSPDGKHYRLGDKLATLMVRPRGWHLSEKHLRIDGQPVSASLFDFGLFFFHNAAKLVQKGTAPYFYLPKLESHLEARLWNDAFVLAQDKLGIPRGTIRATVLIETILAGFEMDEILYELREHSAGLNCGRWDYIFSFIKKFRNHPQFVLPDRAQVTMDRAFLKAYVDLLIRTCHRRGIHAMGGMAAQIPIKTDPVANEAALERVRQDKLREVAAGHDGTWVAHPGLVPVARTIFDASMPHPNQIEKQREDVRVAAADLVAVPAGEITEKGLRTNISIGIQYLEAWLRGSGCVPLYNLMEDAATAEISRSQVWQWVRHEARLADGRTVTPELVNKTMSEEMRKMQQAVGVRAFESGKFGAASRLFDTMMTSGEFPEFLTLAAYETLD
jgi:malate synthase